jgi:hypothetical protein
MAAAEFFHPQQEGEDFPLAGMTPEELDAAIARTRDRLESEGVLPPRRGLRQLRPSANGDGGENTSLNGRNES